MTLSRRRFLVLGAGGALALGSRALPSTGALAFPPPGRWTSAPDAPWSLQEVYAAVRGRTVVVAGGMRSSADGGIRFETLAGTAVFDTASETWERGPDLPAPRHHLVLASAGGAIHGYGGFVGESLRDGFRFRGDVFTLRDGGWSRAGRMPVPLGETVAAVLDGRVHLATGSLHPPEEGPTGATGRHLVHDPADGSWTTARPAPTARSSAAGAVVDGRLYVVGGRRRGPGGLENLGALERYDPEADRWESLRPLPRPAGGLAGAALDGALYCFGGERFGPGGGEVFGSTWAYRPEADEWREMPPMPTPRHGLAAAAVDGRVWAVGGNTEPAVGGATSSVAEALVPADGA